MLHLRFCTSFYRCMAFNRTFATLLCTCVFATAATICFCFCTFSHFHIFAFFQVPFLFFIFACLSAILVRFIVVAGCMFCLCGCIFLLLLFSLRSPANELCLCTYFAHGFHVGSQFAACCSLPMPAAAGCATCLCHCFQFPLQWLSANTASLHNHVCVCVCASV